MILRFIFGLSALVMTVGVYFVVTTAETNSAEDNLPQDDWQTALCLPEDELLGELLLLDPEDSLSVMVLEDEAFSWGLLAPETSVLVNYAPPTFSSQVAVSVDDQCEGASFIVGDMSAYEQPFAHPDKHQCFHPRELLGQAQ